MNKLQSISDNEFAQVVAESYCWRDVLNKLGYGKNSGSMNKYIKKRVNELNINIDHFDPKNKMKGINKSKITFTNEQIFCKGSKYKALYSLRNKLIKENIIEYKCAECEQEPFWNGKDLSLQMDHINGDNEDHSLENLRFLCPNCHTQTKTYGSKRMLKNICIQCGKKLKRKSKTGLCMNCLYYKN